jgi:hypothetical protein
MNAYFMPYAGEEPATVLINGHRVVLVSRDPEQLEAELESVGGDRICALDEDEYGGEEQLLTYFAQTTKAHVVMTPTEVPLAAVIEGLERELPWIQ